MKKRAAQNQTVQARGPKTTKRLRPPKPPAPPKATSVSMRKHDDEDDFFGFENQEVQSMFGFLKNNNPSLLK